MAYFNTNLLENRVAIKDDASNEAKTQRIHKVETRQIDRTPPNKCPKDEWYNEGEFP